MKIEKKNRLSNGHRVYLKNAFWKMCVTICGRFCLNEGKITERFVEEVKRDRNNPGVSPSKSHSNEGYNLLERPQITANVK